MIYNLLFLISLLPGLLCSQTGDKSSLVNTAHLDHLFEEVHAGTDSIGIIHIYAEYPDYNWFDDSDEGSACVDDAARALIFYLFDYKAGGDETSLNKTKKLLNYLFYMQAENGWFYNFTWKDMSVNKEFKTSVAEPNWWSWRAMWALSEAYSVFYKDDPELAGRIKKHIYKILPVLISWLDKNKGYETYEGLKTPDWLPYGSAADQAAIILKGLSVYYNTSKDSSVTGAIKKLADGIIEMQAGSSTTFPYCVFLSWQNTWHAWGNSQADALLSAGSALNDTLYINSALKETEFFYPWLLKEHFLSGFSITKKGSDLKPVELNKYSQIAYSIRPAVFAALHAYSLTKEVKYAELAGHLAGWFFGNNPASAVMYDRKSGRCFDGIISDTEINKNSGAESTIECLLVLQKIEQVPAAKAVLEKYIADNYK